MRGAAAWWGGVQPAAVGGSPQAAPPWAHAPPLVLEAQLLTQVLFCCPPALRPLSRRLLLEPGLGLPVRPGGRGVEALPALPPGELRVTGPAWGEPWGAGGFRALQGGRCWAPGPDLTPWTSLPPSWERLQPPSVTPAHAARSSAGDACKRVSEGWTRDSWSARPRGALRGALRGQRWGLTDMAGSAVSAATALGDLRLLRVPCAPCGWAPPVCPLSLLPEGGNQRSAQGQPRSARGQPEVSPRSASGCGDGSDGRGFTR